jgi:hypothetical protein
VHGVVFDIFVFAPAKEPGSRRNECMCAALSREGSIREEDDMRALAIALLAGAASLSVGSAKASDIYTSSEYASPDLVQQVRLVCDDAGCYRTRGGSRVIVGDSYNYYGPRRYYRDWDDGPRFGFRAPGVSVGVGVDRW